MLIAAAIFWRRRRRLSRTGEEPEPKRRSPVLMGAAISVVELPTAFPYLAVIVAIVGSGVSLTRQLLLLVIYNGCFVLPLLVIVVTLTFAGEEAITLLARVRRFFRKHWPVIAAALALLAGVFVTVLGVTGLTGRAGGNVGRFSRRLRHLITTH
jgi:cytochrome c biogenesis protein CcdA